jgi:hypothetical protein
MCIAYVVLVRSFLSVSDADSLAQLKFDFEAAREHRLYIKADIVGKSKRRAEAWQKKKFGSNTLDS